MKKLILSLSIIMALASCTKDKMDSQLQPALVFTKKISKITTASNMYPAYDDIYTYDGQGRAASHVNSNGRVYNFDYSTAGKILFTEKNSAGTLLTNREYTLNEKGLVIGKKIMAPDGAVTYNYTFTYNNDGYRTKMEYTNSGKTYLFDFEYANGNLKTVKYYLNGVYRYTTDFIFDTNHINSIPAGDEFYDWNIFGKNDKNVYIERKTTQADGTVSFHEKLVNEYDASGYLIKSVSTELVGTDVNTYTYQYQ